MKNLRRAAFVSAGLLLLTIGCSGGSSTSGGSPARPVAGSGDHTGMSAGTGTGVTSGDTSSTTGGSTTGGPGTGFSSPPTGAGTAGSGSGAAGAGTAGAGAIVAPGTAGTGAGGSDAAGGAGGGAGTAAAGTTGAAGAITTSPAQSFQGSLTAGTWDDNLNFNFYQGYLANLSATQLAGLPLIERSKRLEITVVDGAGAPLAGARVTVGGATGTLFSSLTRGDGKLFFFPGALPFTVQTGDALQITATFAQASAMAAAHIGDAKVVVTVTGTQATPAATLDLAIVVDTTGSMGDELEYLKVELADIIGNVAQDFPGVAQRWALIFYRDTVDEYVVRAFDFTTSLETLQASIAAQSAAGGGDIPEAPDQALARLTTLSWRPDSVARMAFWVADAPHHAAQAPAMAKDILSAHDLGIRLYPISASGTDELLEYTMRTAAEVTGGRYLFLTNDSGIGGGHKEPTIPCYVVTTLEKAMLRMVRMELTGTDSQPAAADIVRTSGNPKDGTCTLASGQIVTVL